MNDNDRVDLIVVMRGGGVVFLCDTTRKQASDIIASWHGGRGTGALADLKGYAHFGVKFADVAGMYSRDVLGPSPAERVAAALEKQTSGGDEWKGDA